MLPARFARALFALIMSLYMVTGMTFVVTWANTGLSAGFIARWLNAGVIAWPIAFLLVIIGAPRIQNLVGKLVKQP